eukprot:764178-Hanusia_phi.AAC.2
MRTSKLFGLVVFSAAFTCRVTSGGLLQQSCRDSLHFRVRISTIRSVPHEIRRSRTSDNPPRLLQHWSVLLSRTVAYRTDGRVAEVVLPTPSLTELSD